MLSANRTLVLHAGYYTNHVPEHYATFLLQDGCTVIGDGWTTIIDEPDAPSFVVFNTALDFALGTNAGNKNIFIGNLQLKGKGSISGLTSQSTIALGNVVNCSIENVYFNGTAAIAISVGNSADAGYYADSISIRGCVFDAVPSENIGVVNAQNVRIVGCAWKNSANSAGAIDCEPNASNQRLVSVVISSNSMAGFGVLVQGGGGATLSGIEIVGNTMSGVEFDGARNTLLASNNFAAPSGTNAITVYNADGCEIAGNRFVNAGQAPGGGVAISCQQMTNCLVSNNYFYNPHVTSGYPGWSAIVEIPGTGCDKNRYYGNTLELPVDSPDALNFPIVSVDGANSRV
jgi:hypothetical protein